MDTAQLLVTVLSAGGGGAVVLALANGIVKWLSGASGRERTRNTDLTSQRTDAIKERESAESRADSEAAKRRKVEEALSAARRQLIENGVNPGEWPLERTVNPRKLN